MAGPVLSLPREIAGCSLQKLFDGFFIINGFVDTLLKFGIKFSGGSSVFDAPWAKIFNLWYAINGTDIVVLALFSACLAKDLFSYNHSRLFGIWMIAKEWQSALFHVDNFPFYSRNLFRLSQA